MTILAVVARDVEIAGFDWAKAEREQPSRHHSQRGRDSARDYAQPATAGLGSTVLSTSRSITTTILVFVVFCSSQITTNSVRRSSATYKQSHSDQQQQSSDRPSSSASPVVASPPPFARPSLGFRTTQASHYFHIRRIALSRATSDHEGELHPQQRRNPTHR